MSDTFATGRVTLTLELKLHSPMHIGSGFQGAARQSDESQPAEILLGISGRPVIPPTTLKGALRALASEAFGKESAAVTGLFGEINDDNRDTGQMGSLSVSLAMASPADGASSDIISVTKVAIDATSGTAATNLLFKEKQVKRNTMFEARVVLRGNEPAHETALKQLLDHWKRIGLKLGRGKGDGAGWLKLERIANAERLTITDKRVITSSGGAEIQAWRNEIEPVQRIKRTGRFFKLTLTGTEPFVVKSNDKVEGPGVRQNTLYARKISENLPDLPGSSLMGVLRSRATWWARREEMRGHNIDVTKRISRLFGQTSSEVGDARSTASNDTGFAGILRIDAIVPGTSTPETFESVRIDRFTYAPFDTGLFSVEAFPNARFTVALSLDQRADAADVAFTTAFFAALSGAGPLAGLTLGHGGNRGFGWFKVDFKEIGT